MTERIVTEEQFNRFLAVQIAQVAALEAISQNLASLAMAHSKQPYLIQWDTVKQILRNAKSAVGF
jgi:hypothetical protein